MKQRIFLSYASPDSDWVKKFCDQRWFGSLLPDVEIDNYQDMVNFGSIRRWIDEEINSVAVLIAFISRDYIESKYSQVEWQRAREIFAEHNLIVVPIIMDDYAKIWWKERKVEFGRDFGIGGDDSYAFLNFSHPNDTKHVVPIIGLDGPIQVVTQRISDLARLIKSHLKPIKPESVIIDLEPVTDKPESPAALSTKDVFVSFCSEDVAAADEIVGTLESAGFACWISNRDVWQNYQEEIVDAIRSAKAMIVIFSTNANHSEEIKKELSLAGKYKVRRFPIRIEDATPDGAFEYEFSTSQYIDYFRNRETAITRITQSLRRAIELNSRR